MLGASPPISRPIPKRARPSANGRPSAPRSTVPPTTAIPIREPRKNAEKTQPYSSLPSSSWATMGRTVETASASKATRVMVRTSPALRTRRCGDQRPSFALVVGLGCIREGWRTGVNRAGQPASASPFSRAATLRVPPEGDRRRRSHPPGSRPVAAASRSSASRAAPVTGRPRARATCAAGTVRRIPSAMRPSKTASDASKTPPARTTSGSDRTRPSRRLIETAIVASSSARRSTMSRATPSPSAAAAKTTGARCRTSGSRIAPRSMALVTSMGRCRPKCAGTVRSRTVRGPRPSRARTAAPSPAIATSPPPPQSPEMAPNAAKRAVRPFGAIPAAFTPAPQMMATPQPRSEPIRTGVKASFTTYPVVGERTLREGRA